MSTTTPTGWFFRDPKISYRGLIFVDGAVLAGDESTRVYALDRFGQTAFVKHVLGKRERLIATWDETAQLIWLARAHDLYTCDGVPWEIHLIQDRDAWWQAVKAWKNEQP